MRNRSKLSVSGVTQRGALAALFVLALTCSAEAQKVHDEGWWTALFSQGQLGEDPNGKWRWWFDGHARFFDDTEGFGQSIVRPGVGYAISDNATVWAGYGWIRTAPGSGSDFDENRIWQQITWSKNCEPIRFGLRSRLEQRFLETGDDTGWRFRQFFRVWHTLPEYPRFSLVAWDEVFLNLNDTDYGARTGLDQNRVFAGFGWTKTPDSKLRTEIGYMNQFINASSGPDRSNHLVAVNFFWRP